MHAFRWQCIGHPACNMRNDAGWQKQFYSLRSETWTTKAVWRRAFYFHKILLRWNCKSARRRIAGSQQMCSVHCANAIVSVLYAQHTWVNEYLLAHAKSGRKLNLFDKFMSVETSTWADTRQWKVRIGKMHKIFRWKTNRMACVFFRIYSQEKMGNCRSDLYAIRISCAHSIVFNVFAINMMIISEEMSSVYDSTKVYLFIWICVMRNVYLFGDYYHQSSYASDVYFQPGLFWFSSKKITLGRPFSHGRIVRITDFPLHPIESFEKSLCWLLWTWAMGRTSRRQSEYQDEIQHDATILHDRAVKVRNSFR